MALHPIILSVILFLITIIFMGGEREGMTASAATIDLNSPLKFSTLTSLMEAPGVFREVQDPHAYIILPRSFQPLPGPQSNPNASSVSVTQLSTGRLMVRMKLGPFPKVFMDHPAYRGLMEELKKQDPSARLAYPELRDPKFVLLGPHKNFLSAPPTIAGIQGDVLRSWDITFFVKAEHAVQFKTDLKRPLGILGKMEFITTAKSGNQILDWPVGFSWSIGDIIL